jgi:Ser/Thr protein kinase RdoA (MazF antagonist)
LRALRWHSPRPLSAAAIVGTEAGSWFIKRHAQRVRSAETLTEEHRFMAHLRACGVPVPTVLADARGHTAVALGEWVYEVHATAEGVDLYRDAMSWTPVSDLAHARHAGRALAHLHDGAEGYAAAQRDTHLLVARCELIVAPDPIAALRAQLPQRLGLADYLAGRDWQVDFARVIAPLHHIAQPRLARQPRLWTHNDWHVSNLCWNGRGSDADVSAVLDFGLAAPTFALFDLATAIERNAIAWLELERGSEAAHIDVALALIDGYRERRRLEAAQLELLADLLPLVHVDFALSEVEYFHAITRSRANADVAYDTFLLGHATWFGTPPGQALLQAIRNA